MVASGTDQEKSPVNVRLRRAETFDAGGPTRRRSTAGLNSDDPLSRPVRRGSTFSAFSQDVNPRTAPLERAGKEEEPNSNWSSLPLAFAVLPAIGGVVVQGGSAFVTDLLLLGLGAIFMQWSLTEPWVWYHRAQEVRIVEEEDFDVTFETDSDVEVPTPTSVENGSKEPESLLAREQRRLSEKHGREREDALRELKAREFWAFAACFFMPIVGASLLHAIRGQLSRPSEGLISNYNLTIFTLGAELRPVRHLFKLIRNQTLHLQRIVQADPDQEPKPSRIQLSELVKRLDELQHRVEDAETTAGKAGAEARASAKATQRQDPKRERDMLVREVQDLIQPSLDLLARSCRQNADRQDQFCEKVNAKFDHTDVMLSDCITDKPREARIAGPQKSTATWLVDQLTAIMLLPFQPVLWVLDLIFRIANRAIYGDMEPPRRRSRRTTRNGRPLPQPRLGMERVPRVSHR